MEKGVNSPGSYVNLDAGWGHMVDFHKNNLYLAVRGLVCACLLGGCAIGPSSNDQPTTRIKTYFGLVRIAPPTHNGPQKAYSMEALGAWLGEDGAGIGFIDQTNIELTDDCRIVFIIRNLDDLEAAIALVNSTLEHSEDKICVS